VLRLPVYKVLLHLADSNDEVHVLQLSRADVDKWLNEWDVAPAEKSAFLKTLVDVFSKAGQTYVLPSFTTSSTASHSKSENPPHANRDNAYHYKLVHVRSLDPASKSTQPAALNAIATAVSDPAVLDFDPLFKLDAVLAAKSHPLFALLRIFLNGGLDDLRAWQRAHADVSSTFRLDPEQLECKIRLLALADLGFQNIGQDLPYARVAATLQVTPSEVERWVIDGSPAPLIFSNRWSLTLDLSFLTAIRAGLLTGKLAQPAQTLRVTRATARAFGPPEWALLVKRLAGWRAGIAGVLDVVAGARHRNESVVAAMTPGEKQSDAPGEAEGAAFEATA
jgi:translation initiation factor 3 subunit M